MSATGSITQLVHRLKASGATAEMLADVLETFAGMLDSARMSGGIPVDTAAEKRRAYDRDRKAKARAMSGGKSGGIPPEVRIDTPSPPGSPLSLPQTPTHTPLYPPTPSAPRRERGCALPADWQPSAKHFDLASDLGCNERFVWQQAEAMREWAGANRNRAVARKADWDLTFTGWLRRETGKSGGSRAPPRRGFGDIVREGLQEIERRENGERHRETDHSGPTLDFGAGGEGADQFDLQPARGHGW